MQQTIKVAFSVAGNVQPEAIRSDCHNRYDRVPGILGSAFEAPPFIAVSLDQKQQIPTFRFQNWRVQLYSGGQLIAAKKTVSRALWRRLFAAETKRTPRSLLPVAAGQHK